MRIVKNENLEILLNQIDSNKLPNAFLLFGKKNTGKRISSLSIALNLLKSNILSPNLLIINNIDLNQAKAYFSASYEHKKEYLDYIKKIIDSKVLLLEDSSLKKSQTFISDFNSFYHGNLKLNDLELIKLISELEKNLSSNLSIDQSRKIKQWIFQEINTPKVVIINEIENFSFSVYNSFLKILEETPKNIYFILSSRNLNKIPKTILSRLRTYKFSKMSDNKEKEKTNFIFQKEINLTLDDYFASFSLEKESLLKEKANECSNLVIEKKMIKEVKEIENQSDLDLFLNYLLLSFKDHFLKKSLSLKKLNKINSLIINLKKDSVFNLSNKNMILNLFLEIEETND